jgi:trehalose/maltose transport system permease protein
MKSRREEGQTPLGAVALRPAARREMSERALAAIMLAPAMLLGLALVIYPVGRLLSLSLHRFRLTAPTIKPFVGLHNFVAMFSDPRFLDASRVTIIYVVGSVIFPLIIGVAMALLVNKAFRGRWVARLAVILPWAMPAALAAGTWAWILDTTYGVLNETLMSLRIIASPIPWLGAAHLAMLSLILVTTWKTSSFVGLMVLAGLQSIPTELYDAAAVDGAGGIRAFWLVTLPLLRPYIMVALIFRTIVAIQVFDIPYALTQGGPGVSTEPLSMYVYEVTLNNLNFGYGASLAVFMAVISVVLTIVYMRALRHE